MEIFKSKETDQVFVHLDAEGKDKALLITPNGIVLALYYELFMELVEIEADEALADGIINRAQYNTYKANYGH